MPDATVLASAPFPLALRNFVPTGLASELEARFGVRVRFVSPYAQPEFTDGAGHSFLNFAVAASAGANGVPALAGVTALDRALKSIHLTGFAMEYPDGSLQNLELSRRHSAQNQVARILAMLAPRASGRRQWLRRVAALYRPARRQIQDAFDRTNPAMVLVASPGHYWLDHFVLDEAARRRIPSVCVVLSWDNLYSRGPMCRRPDHLLVWSEEMRRQAMTIHQYPENRIGVVGPLQFRFYAEPPTAEELGAMRRRIGLGPAEPFIAYVCGVRTARYDVEDVTAMLDALAHGPYRDFKVVVRPHPQGSREAYEALRTRGVLLDPSPDLTHEEAQPEALDTEAIRHMASLLDGAHFVVSSWGTTALLEACIFDTPSVQLRWMDALPHSVPEEVQLVRDFQRYIHMRAFDATGARPYCDRPETLNAILADLESRADEFSRRRAEAVGLLAHLPLGDVVQRVCERLRPVLPQATVRPPLVQVAR